MFTTLHQILLELKANAAYVLNLLGDGVHGFIGIILPFVTFSVLVPIQQFSPIYLGLLLNHGET